MTAAVVQTILKQRYRLESQIGRGAMGEVWRATDLELSSDCAVKIMRDSADPTALELFSREQTVLAELRSPHIVQINDRGVFDSAVGKRPFFVMPLLRGNTLAGLIKASGNRITPEWLVEVLKQVCRGLQSAHSRNIYHRDLKPSNIMVDEDDSATIIDFGVAHLGNSQNSGFRGTPQYTAPELVDLHSLHEPSSASDLFSLGVIVYEAFTRQRPFERGSDRETLQAVLGHHPPAVWKLNPEISIGLGKVVHKAIAKAPLHRFSSAREFADTLQKALRGQALPEHDPSRISTRMELAKRAFESGDYPTCRERVLELQNEGEIDERLADLGNHVETAIRQKTIQEKLESARTLVAREDPMAVAKVQEVLLIDPQNAEAHSLLNDVRKRKSTRDIENWFSLARRHLETHDYRLAREALQEVLNIGRDSRAFAMLVDVDRLEKEHEAVCAEKERLFQEARRAHENGEFSTALSKLGRILALIRPVAGSIMLERDVAFQEFFSRVQSEHDEINNAHKEGQKHLADGNFEKTVEICARYPENPLFQALKLEAEEHRRHQRSAFLADVSLRVEAEPDLDKKVAILEDAARRYPGDPQFEERLGIAHEKRGLVAAIVERARGYEKGGEFNEALTRWESLRKIYPLYPGLSFEIERLTRQRDRDALSDALARWEDQIDRCLRMDDHERALSLCKSALGEFPDAAALKDRQRQALEGVDLAAHAQRLLEEAEELISRGRSDEGLVALRAAQQLPVRSPLVRVLLVDTLSRHALILVDTDWHAAASLVEEALKLDPNHGPANSLFGVIEEYRRTESVEECVSRARLLEKDGDLKAAVDTLEDRLAVYPGDSKLTELVERLRKEWCAVERPQVLTEIKELWEAAQAERDPAAVHAIVEKARGLTGRYAGDQEILEIAARIERRESQINGSWLRRWRQTAKGVVARLTRHLFAKTQTIRRGWRPKSPRLLKYRWLAVAGLRPLGRKIAAGVFGALVLAVIAVIAWRMFPEPNPPIERWFGTAVVRVPKTNLLVSPQASSKTLLSFQQGTRFNVLDPKLALAGPFVPVQYVSHKRNSKRGYMRTADLDQWYSTDPTIAWMLVGRKRPLNDASEEVWRQFLDELKTLADRFGGKSQADEVNLERARLYLRFATEEKNSGIRATELSEDLQNLERTLVSVSAARTTEVAELHRRADELKAPTQHPTPEEKLQLNALYNRAAPEYFSGTRAGWELAKSLARQMLKIDPNDKRAKGLLEQMSF